jgi:uncharacterized protein (TIRG00374 family)
MTRRRWIQAAVLLAVGLLILVGLFRTVHVSEVARAIQHASGWLVLTGMLSIPVFILLRGWRWQIILHASAPHASFADATAVTAIGFAVNSVAAFKVGELLRMAAIARRAQVAVAEALATVAIERVLDVVALFVIAVAAAIASGSGSAAGALWRGVAAFSLVSLAGGAFAFWLVSNPDRTLSWWVRLAGRLPAGLQTRAVNLGESVLRGLSSLRSVRRLLGTFALSIAIWAVLLLGSLAYFRSVSDQLPLGTLVLAFALFTITQAVSITPGSVGTFEGFYLLVLSAAFGARPQSVVAAAAILTHVGGIVVLLVLGALGALWLRLVPAVPVRFQRPVARQDSA